MNMADSRPPIILCAAMADCPAISFNLLWGMFCPADVQSRYKSNMARAGPHAASGCRRPAQNSAFICATSVRLVRVPLPLPCTTGQARSTNLATSQLASSIQFQNCDRLSFKFVIAASRSESLRSRVRVFDTSVSSS